MEKLVAFLKPVFPDEATNYVAQTNAKKWAESTCKGLCVVYQEECDAKLRNELSLWSELTLKDFATAWRAAVHWGRNNYKKLSTETLEKLFEFLKTGSFYNPYNEHDIMPVPCIHNSWWLDFETQAVKPVQPPVTLVAKPDLHVVPHADTENLHSQKKDYGPPRPIELSHRTPRSGTKTPSPVHVSGPLTPPDSHKAERFFSTAGVESIEEKMAQLVRINSEHETLFREHKNILVSLQLLLPKTLFHV